MHKCVKVIDVSLTSPELRDDVQAQGGFKHTTESKLLFQEFAEFRQPGMFSEPGMPKREETRRQSFVSQVGEWQFARADTFRQGCDNNIVGVPGPPTSVADRHADSCGSG